MVQLLRWVLPVIFMASAGCHQARERTDVVETKSWARSPASLTSQIQMLDPKKKTVCTMTLNSENEREKFQKNLKEFNFIELTGPGDWFKNACQQNVQCDVLVVSAHFAGVFFGIGNTLRLPLEDVEHMSCQKSCDGILQKPKEVFLFGCNTLAGKTPDRRSPEKFIQDLRDDGLSIRLAHEMASLRYSPIGPEFRHRMRQVFSNKNTRIYGFSSVGPSGSSVSAHLDRYFKSIKGQYGSYKNYLNKQVACTEKGDLFTRALAKTDVAKACGDDSPSPVCVLNENTPVVKKLSWLDSVLNDPKLRLAYAPNINAYMDRLESKFGSNWPDVEKSYFERLQYNSKAKEDALKVLQSPVPGWLVGQVAAANMALKLGWVRRAEYVQRVQTILGGMLSKNLNAETREVVCAAGPIELDLSHLPREKWSDDTLHAIACMRPSDPKTHWALVSLFRDQRLPTRWSAIRALGATKTQNEKIHFILLDLIPQSDPQSGVEAVDALLAIQPKSTSVHEAIRKLIEQEDFEKRYQAVRLALGVLRDADSARMLVAHLEDSSRDIRDAVARGIYAFKPSEELQLFVSERLKHSDALIRADAAWALINIKSNVPAVQMALVDALADPENLVHSRAENALYLVKLDPSVKTHLIEMPQTAPEDLKNRVQKSVSRILLEQERWFKKSEI